MRAIYRFWLDIGRSLRVAGLAVLFVWCTASQCLTQNTDIQYAAGYGYVVVVECEGCQSKQYYVMFSTYEQASTWLKNWSDRFDYVGNAARLPNFPKGYATYYDRHDKEYYKITPLLGPPPNGYPTATPELNQPNPVVPQ